MHAEALVALCRQLEHTRAGGGKLATTNASLIGSVERHVGH